MFMRVPPSFGFLTRGPKLENYPYLNLPNPTFLSVLIINPNMEFIGTRQKSRFWWVKVGYSKNSLRLDFAEY